MKKLEFNDLVNAVLNEDNFLQKIGKGAANWASKPSNWVGAAAAAVNAPKAIHTAVTGRGQIGRGLNALQGALAKREQKKEEERKKQEKDAKGQRPTRTATDTKIEDFDKDVIKTLLAKSKTGTSAAQQTTTGTVQAPGQVAGGTATPTSASGTSSGAVSAPITQSPSATQRDPKEGDVFALVGKYGRVKRYQVKKIDGNIVSAAPMI